jgi:hypothetical protein
MQQTNGQTNICSIFGDMLSLIKQACIKLTDARTQDNSIATARQNQTALFPNVEDQIELEDNQTPKKQCQAH